VIERRGNNVHLSDRNHNSYSPIRTLVLRSGVVLRPNIANRGHLSAGQTDRERGVVCLGQKDDRQYQNYHRVLNRAKWSSFTASKILLGLLVGAFVAAGVPVIIGADETLERRKGEKIKDKSVFRDALRSSKKYTVHSFGLRC